MVEISRSPVLRPLQLSIFNLFPKISWFKSARGKKRNPIGLVCEPGLRFPPRVNCNAVLFFFFFNSPLSNWKRMLLRKQLTFYQPRHGGGHEENRPA